MMTAAEVFISLHSIDATKDGVPLRKVMACLDPCMKEDMRSTFPPEAMAVALQQLVTRYSACYPVPSLQLGTWPVLTFGLVCYLATLAAGHLALIPLLHTCQQSAWQP